ncbi:hypothetical protein A2U01_0068400, partial [Trifolium medium]|nr:hypothetical protein [Trifolium medium]
PVCKRKGSPVLQRERNSEYFQFSRAPTDERTGGGRQQSNLEGPKTEVDQQSRKLGGTSSTNIVVISYYSLFVNRRGPIHNGIRSGVHDTS